MVEEEQQQPSLASSLPPRVPPPPTSSSTTSNLSTTSSNKNNDSQHEEEDEDEEEECFFNPALFVNTTTRRLIYKVHEIEQPVLASTASSTDHDLTGQIIWPVSLFLSWFVAAPANRGQFQQQQVLELGAGCAGLPGVIASHFSREGVLLTDGNELVLEMLEKSLAEGRKAHPHQSKIEARQLLWGDAQSVQSVIESGWRPQFLLGADVVCWPDMVIPLLQTVKFFFLCAPDPLAARLFLGFVNRATATERLLYTHAEAMGMKVERVASEMFLPKEKEEWPEELRKAQQTLELLIVRLDEHSPVHLTAVVFEDGHDWTKRATPC